MSKEHFIAAHEKLVAEYMDRHPDVDWATAYDKTADKAYDRMRDDLADLADAAKDRAKEEGNWPPRSKS